MKHNNLAWSITFSMVCAAFACSSDGDGDFEFRSVEPTGPWIGYGEVIGVTAGPYDGFLRCIKTDNGPWNSTGGGLVEFYVDGVIFDSVNYAPQPKVGGDLYKIYSTKSVFEMFNKGEHLAQCIAYPKEDGLVPSEGSGFEDCGGYACTRSAVWGFRVTGASGQQGYCSEDFPGQGNGVQENIEENCDGGTVGGYERRLSVPHYWQDQPCWCSVTIVEMWSDFLNDDSHYSSHQEEIAEQYGIPGVDCGEDGDGMNVHEMVTAMTDQTAGEFEREKYESERKFIKHIVKEINSGKPVGVTGYTRFNDERGLVANQHWYLVYGFKNSTEEYSSKRKNVECFYLHDPVYGAGLDYIDSVSPDDCISPDDFLSEFASEAGKWNKEYYLVRQKEK